MADRPVRVALGLDLGTNTGWSALAVATQARVDSGAWKFRGSPGERYTALRRNVLDLLSRFDGWVEFLAVELPIARLQSMQARRLGYGFLATAEVVAVARDVAIVEVVNTKTKMALGGHGRASKREQIGAAKRRFGVEVGEHEADALGVALAGLEAWKGHF